MKTQRVRRAFTSRLDPLLAVPVVVLILYFGKPVILPLVLAALGAFVLSPLVTMVERNGLSRLGAVLVVVLLSGVGMGFAVYGVAQQLGALMRELPEHTVELQKRMRAVKDASTPLSDAAATFERVSGAAQSQRERTVFVEPKEGVFSGALEYLRLAAGPAATGGLVIVLMLFMLMGREDLRNRLVSLMGRRRLVDATRILVDSGQRLSRMLATQLAINTGLGVAFGAVLWLLGVPYWFLWGALTVALRFVPFVGAWLAALLPFTVSLILTPGWLRPLASLGAFAVLDLITANAVEPLLIGRRTGVTPIALLVAAVFWSWLWGPIGLLVSTPLTLTLVVLGSHVPRLKFLARLLGDEKPLTELDACYQRFLAGDEREAQEITTQVSRGDPLAALDGVLLPSLRRSGFDAASGALSVEDEAALRERIERVGRAVLPVTPVSPDAPVVLGVAARRETEVVAMQLLARAVDGRVRLEVAPTSALPSELEARIEREQPELVLVTIVPPRGVAQAEFLCQRLRAKFPALPIVVAHWGVVRDFDRLLRRLRRAGASYLSSNATQTTSQLTTLLKRSGAPHAPATAG